MHHPIDRITHTTAFVTLAGTRNSSWRIDPMTHRIMSKHSYHRVTSRSDNNPMSVALEYLPLFCILISYSLNTWTRITIFSIMSAMHCIHTRNESMFNMSLDWKKCLIFTCLNGINVQILRLPMTTWCAILKLGEYLRGSIHRAHMLIQSGQVRSECLTCTFRASCCSTRLSRAQVLAFTGLHQFLCPGQEKKRGVQGSTSSPTGIGSRQSVFWGVMDADPVHPLV